MEIPITSANSNTPEFTPVTIQQFNTTRVRSIFAVPSHDLYFVAASNMGIIILQKVANNKFVKVADDNLFWSEFQINTVYDVAATATMAPSGEIKGFMFVAAGSQGLITFNYTISNRFGFIANELWTYRQPYSITQQVIIGSGLMNGKLITTEGPQGISILDISDPTHLNVLYTIPISQFFGKITYHSFLSDDLLFVANGEEGVTEFKLSSNSYLLYAIYQTLGIRGLSISVVYLPEIGAVVSSEGEFGALVYPEKGNAFAPTVKADEGYEMNGYSRTITILSSSSNEATLLFSKTYAGWEETNVLKSKDHLLFSSNKLVTGISASTVIKIQNKPAQYLVGGWDGNITYVGLQKVSQNTKQSFLVFSPLFYVFSALVMMIPLLRRKYNNLF